MDTIWLRILLFSGIPIFGFLLYKGIKLIRGAMYGKLILEVSIDSDRNKFQINKKGWYSIWLYGKMFRITPINKFKPKIIELLSSNKIPLSISIARPTVKGFEYGRVQLYTFKAKKGEHQIELTDGSSATIVESALSEILPKNSRKEEFKVQIRKSQPAGLQILGVLLTIVSAILILISFVAGLLAHEIFAN